MYTHLDKKQPPSAQAGQQNYQQTVLLFSSKKSLNKKPAMTVYCLTNQDQTPKYVIQGQQSPNPYLPSYLPLLHLLCSSQTEIMFFKSALLFPDSEFLFLLYALLKHFPSSCVPSKTPTISQGPAQMLLSP